MNDNKKYKIKSVMDKTELVRTTLYLPKWLHAMIHDIAQETNFTASDVLRKFAKYGILDLMTTSPEGTVAKYMREHDLVKEMMEL